MNEKLQKKQEFNGVTKQFLNFNTDSIDDLDKFKKEFKPIMHLKGEAFNQQLQNLINKYPEIKKSMNSDFIAYYDKKSTKNVNKYSWDLQIPTNDTMKKIPGSKMMYFYKDSVSPSEIGEDGRLENKTNKITMSGGNWEEIQKEIK